MLDKKDGKTKDKDDISTTDNINKKQNNMDDKNKNMSIDIIKENHSEKNELINIIENYMKFFLDNKLVKIVRDTLY